MITDEHAERVCRPLREAWAEFEQDPATLLDLSRLAEEASNALDNASAPLPQLLARAASDLDFASFVTEREEYFEKAKRIMRSLPGPWAMMFCRVKRWRCSGMAFDH